MYCRCFAEQNVIPSSVHESRNRICSPINWSKERLLFGTSHFWSILNYAHYAKMFSLLLMFSLYLLDVGSFLSMINDQ